MEIPTHADGDSRGGRGRAWAAVGLVALFGVGFIAGVVFSRGTGHEVAPTGLVRSMGGEKRAGQRGLINPLLECTVPRGGTPLDLLDFEAMLLTAVNRLKGEGAVRRVSVYFRDLHNGPWFGFGEDEEFRPGSLLKVPLMIGYLKWAESDGALLDRVVTVDDPELLKLYNVQGVAPSMKLELGGTYRVRELIERMIVYSDNVAASMLEKYDRHESIIRTAREMDIPVRVGFPPYRNVSIKEYAGFLRILYNASYLTPSDSEWALRLLEGAEFRGGLVAGVPPGVRTARKFGEAWDTVAGENVFSDCGIVYVPELNYVLCLVLGGQREEDLVEASRRLSAWVFSEVLESIKPLVATAGATGNATAGVRSEGSPVR